MLNRRDFLKIGMTGASICILDPIMPLAAWAQEEDPHFFVHLLFRGGFDNSYFFDARPLAMTQAKKIQNYSGIEPTLWEGKNGTTTWAAAKTDSLRNFKNDITILNGVLMTPSFNGHNQNMNYLLTGNPTGGENFMPHLNESSFKRPLDGIIAGELYGVDQTNFSNFVPLAEADAKNLVNTIKQKTPFDPENDVWQFIRSRFQANARGAGSFSSGARSFNNSVLDAAKLESYVRSVDFPEGDIKFSQVVGEFFKKGIARSAVVVFDFPETDSHASSSAKKYPELAGRISDIISETLSYLKNTPYDSKRSILDVTTFMTSSEFSRTMRQDDQPFEDTGTDHNNFNNTVILAGKNIEGGQVIGQSDFRTSDEKLSAAHLKFDRHQKFLFGKPFDFATGKPREDLPEMFDLKEYISIGSVINTIYQGFGVPDTHQREFERNGGKIPQIKGLLKS